MTTFIAHPDGDGPFPVAVLYMDGVGYRAQIKANARRFAAAGYYCVAPDLFYRSGEKLTFDFSRMGDEAYRSRLMSIVASVKPDGVVADTGAIFEAIADDPAASNGPKVNVGYCMGARMALHAAAAMPDAFVAAAGIHPSALVTDRPDSPHTVLGRRRVRGRRRRLDPRLHRRSRRVTRPRAGSRSRSRRARSRSRSASSSASQSRNDNRRMPSRSMRPATCPNPLRGSPSPRVARRRGASGSLLVIVVLST